MKQLLRIAILLLIGSTTVIAQSQKNIAQKQQELRDKQEKERQEQANRIHDPSYVFPKKNISLKEYTILKKAGKLPGKHSFNIEGGKLMPVNVQLKPNSTASLTPCDVWPVQGPTAFATEVDDSPLSTIALPYDFCFYGVTYNSINISSNGNVQFATNSTAFSSTGFPSGPGGVNMIAPFWSDGETMVPLGGLIYGKIYIDYQPTYTIISWDSLGYFNNHVDKLNSFQLVLTDGLDPILPPGKNVGFRYRKMEWTTGDASDGLNGFPDPSTPPAIPATVGINQGNGVDYYLVGRFGVPGTTYDGPLGADDGISWLDGKSFYFNVCPPVGANVEPISTLIGYCDTLKVCGNDTLYIKNTFLAPEVTQTVNITASAPTLGSSFSYSVVPNSNSSNIFMIVDGNTAPAGYHTITMTATDNGSPVQSALQNFVVYVNQSALNNLDGSIVVTPTLGACPGGTVTASVNVSGGMPDSYYWSNSASSATTTFTTVVSADSLIYVTLSSGQCSKTILGHININPVPVAAITGSLSYCNGNANNTALTATNTSIFGSQAPYTYAWAATSGSLSSTSTQTTNANAGVFTVTVTNQYGCKSTASTTVTMNESPSYSLSSANAVSNGSVYCVSQDSAHITLNFGTASSAACGLGNGSCVSPSVIAVGTGTTSNTNTGTPCVYGNYFKNERHQMLFTAAELLAAGVVPGKLSSVSFSVASLQPINTTSTSSSSTWIGTLPNYSIKLKCTPNTVLTSTFVTGLTEVFFGDITPIVGLNTHNFSQPYMWDGTSNLIVDVCYTRNTTLSSSYYTSNPVMRYTNVGANRCVYYNSDSNPACGNTTGTTTNNRPNIRFGNCKAQQSGSQFDVVVTPTTGVSIPAAHDSLKIELPGTVGTVCYTVSLVNPLGGCNKDTVICLTSIQGTTQATLATNNATVCPGSPITLSATGALSTYTISYLDANGNPQTSVNASVTFTPESVSSPTFGVHTYTLSAMGSNCGAPLASFTQTIDVVQGVTQGTLTASLPSTCPNGTVTLSTQGSLASYTISYVDNLGALQTSVNSSVTVTTPSVSGTYIYTLSATGPCSGPLTSFTTSVDVITGVTNETLTATSNSICPGTPITLAAVGNLVTYTITYTDDAGLHTSVNSSVTVTPTGTTSPVFGPHTYTLSGMGACGGPLKDTTLVITIIQGPTDATLTASSATVCPGTAVTLNVTGSAVQTYTIVYTDAAGTQTATPNTSITFTPSSISTPSFGVKTYTVFAEGPCSGPLTSFTTTVEVMQGITDATLTASRPTVCPGTAITLDVTGSAVQTYTIVYTDAAGTQTATPNSSVTFTPSSISTPSFGIRTYTVFAEGPCSGPLTSFTTTVEVVQGITDATLTASSNTVCPGGAVTLTVGGSAVQTYTIVYTDAAGTQTATPNSPVTFTPSSISAPSFGVKTYTVFAEGPCSGPVRDFTTSVFVEQGISQSTLTTNSITVCPGSPIIIDQIGNLVTYTLSYKDENGSQTTSSLPVTFIPTSSSNPVFGPHTYTLSGATGCSGNLRDTTITINVSQGNPSNATLTATPNVVCIGSPITLDVLGSFSTYTIQYNNGAGIISANTSTTITTAVSGINTFTLLADAFCNAPTTTSLTTATVNAMTNLSIAPIPNITKCFGGTATLNAIVTPTISGLNYLWTSGGFPAAGTNTLASYTASNTGVYSVAVSGSCAIPTAATVSVNQFTDDLAVSIIDSAAICAKTGFMLNALATGGRPAYNFSWFISSSATSISNSNPLNTNAPDAQGIYSVTVVVTDSCGFTDNDIQLITVLPPCDITIPNIITPNGDGANDVFRITNIEYHSNSVFTVFDRWGRKVYENTNYQNEWRGNDLNDGTYFYILDVPDDKKYNGYITIFSGK